MSDEYFEEIKYLLRKKEDKCEDEEKLQALIFDEKFLSLDQEKKALFFNELFNRDTIANLKFQHTIHNIIDNKIPWLIENLHSPCNLSGIEDEDFRDLCENIGNYKRLKNLNRNERKNIRSFRANVLSFLKKRKLEFNERTLEEKKLDLKDQKMVSLNPTDDKTILSYLPSVGSHSGYSWDYLENFFKNPEKSTIVTTHYFQNIENRQNEERRFEI